MEELIKKLKELGAVDFLTSDGISVSNLAAITLHNTKSTNRTEMISAVLDYLKNNQDNISPKDFTRILLGNYGCSGLDAIIYDGNLGNFNLFMTLLDYLRKNNETSLNDYIRLVSGITKNINDERKGRNFLIEKKIRISSNDSGKKNRKINYNLPTFFYAIYRALQSKPFSDQEQILSILLNRMEEIFSDDNKEIFEPCFIELEKLPDYECLIDFIIKQVEFNCPFEARFKTRINCIFQKLLEINNNGKKEIDWEPGFPPLSPGQDQAGPSNGRRELLPSTSWILSNSSSSTPAKKPPPDSDKFVTLGPKMKKSQSELGLAREAAGDRLSTAASSAPSSPVAVKRAGVK